MANKRMINGGVWEDEFFTTLSIFARLLWVGIITQSADDQGRFRDNAALIRSNVFPLDDIKLSDIENALQEYSKAGKIVRYTADGKELVQIINWWKHQTPRWAGKSNYSEPEGWIDRERYHTTGNVILEKNWSNEGGYIGEYIAGNTINDIKDDVNDDIKDDDDEFAPSFLIQKIIEKNTGYPPNGSKGDKAIKEILEMGAIESDIKEGIKWKIDNGQNVQWYQSLVSPIRTAMAIRIQEKATAAPKSREVFK